MKVLKQGEAWHIDVTCTGLSCGGGGCKSELRIERDDIFKEVFSSYGDIEVNYKFKCMVCGICTKITNGIPASFNIPNRTEWEAKQKEAAAKIVSINKCNCNCNFASKESENKWDDRAPGS